MTRTKQGATLLALIAIWIDFAVFAKDAFLSYFDPDACMNLIRSCLPPAGSLVKANILFFLNSDFYRPFGSVWYRVIYDICGWNPAPFQAVTLLILATNIWLTYAICRRLADSREAGVLAALLISYHASMMPLYFDLGYVYDVLCYFFYFAALLYYLRIRQADRYPGAGALAGADFSFASG